MLLSRLRRPLLVLLVSLASGAVPRPGAAIELPVDPGERDSHSAYIALLDDSRRDSFDRILARYDAWIAAHPNDAQAAVERCRFLELALYDAEMEINPMEEEHLAALEALDTRFANAPEALIVLLESRWGGEEALEFHETRIVPWFDRFDPGQRAEVYTHLQRATSWGALRDRSVEFARLALAEDPGLLFLNAMVARSEWEAGNRTGALALCRKTVREAEEGWLLSEVVDLLVEMEAWEEAAEALERQRELDPDALNPDLEARVLESAGDLAGARRVLRTAAEEMPWRSEEFQRRLFDLALAHGDAEEVEEAYRAFEAAAGDPLLRHRVDVLKKYPSLGLHGSDFLGLGLLILLLVGCALAPLLLLVPFHYVALLRLRRPDRTARETLWGLRHVWLLLGLALVSGALQVYFLCPWEFADFLAEEGTFTFMPPESAMMPMVWLSYLASVILLALLVRPRHLRVLIDSTWSGRRTLGFSILWMVILGNFARVLRFMGTFGEEAMILQRVLLSIDQELGYLGVFLVAVILAPVTEEFLYRGVVLEGFRRYYPFWFANVVQSTVFGLIHEDWSMFPFYFALGFVAGEMRKRSNGLIVPMVFHAINNLFGSLPFLFN